MIAMSRTCACNVHCMCLQAAANVLLHVPRLLANAYSLHIAHLTTGMRIGATAAEKLDLFPVRALSRNPGLGMPWCLVLRPHACMLPVKVHRTCSCCWPGWHAAGPCMPQLSPFVMCYKTRTFSLTLFSQLHSTATGHSKEYPTRKL